MAALLEKHFKFTLAKGIGLLLYSLLIITDYDFTYAYFNYIIAGSHILSGIILISIVMDNDRKSYQNGLFFAFGLMLVVISIVLIFKYIDYTMHFTNVIMMKYWLIVQICFMILYLVILSKLNKKLWIVTLILTIGVICFGLYFFFRRAYPADLSFVYISFIYIGLCNLFVSWIFKNYRKLSNT